MSPTHALDPTVAAPPPLAGTTEPRFWTGTPVVDPERYTLDASRHRSLTSRDGSLAEAMRSTFAAAGLVHVTNTGLDQLSDMRTVARHVLGNQMRYEGGSNPRRTLEPNVYEIGAPLSAWLHYHHEMAYIGQSTEMVAFLCKQALPVRGDTFVADNLAATDALMATPLGEKLRRLGVCYHRNLTDREAFAGRLEVGVYNHWQQSLGTDDPSVAERRARERGLETEWGPDRLLRTRFRISAFEYYGPLGRNLLFSSVADHSVWFDAWPLVRHLPRNERPLDLTFGDGSRLSDDEIEQFIDVYADHGQPIPWQQGDVAVICNYRWAHGRPAIHLQPGEQRELGVLLGRGFPRQGDRASAW